MLQKNKQWILLIYGLGQLFTFARADEILYLELVINGRNTTHIAEITHKENDWEIATKELLGLGIKLGDIKSDRILLSEIQNTEVIYDSELQRLLVNLPSNLLPMQYFGANTPNANQSIPRRDPGFFMNYNLVSLLAKSDNKMTSLWHELHFFNDAFFFVNNGLLKNQSKAPSSSDYTRFETYFQRDNEDKLQSITLGDVINATPHWGQSIRMGGIRIARDYELNPNVITYPLPEFYGESALPASIDLIINNQLNWRDQVTPGPFLINAVPYISGAGVAQIVTTNVQGQQIRQSVDFYVTSELLAPGMFDYDLTVGYRRKNFGLVSNDYEDKPVLSTSLRYGLNRSVTSQLLIQEGDGLHLGGAGITFLAGSVGVFDISAAGSYYNKDIIEKGQQVSIAYDYTYKNVGINASYLKHYGNYHDLGSQSRQLINASDISTRIQAGLSIHDNRLGSFNLGYFRITDPEQEDRSVLNFSWNQYHKHDITTFINLSRILFGKRENTISFTVSVPFGSRGQASDSAQRNANGDWYNQVQILNNAPYRGGIGWGISLDNSPEKNKYLVSNWRTKYSEISLTAAQSKTYSQYSAALAGALVFMDGNIYPTRFVTDSFAVVETEHPDIPVLMGHQLVGRTDTNGKLLIPDLDSYLENRLSIDPIYLPANAVVDSIEKLVTPRRKGGIHVKFPVVLTQSALARVVTPDQQPLPAGAILADKNSDKNFTTGWDGDVYIENLQEPLSLFWADGECMLEITPPIDKTLALPRIGPFVCIPAQEVNQ